MYVYVYIYIIFIYIIYEYIYHIIGILLYLDMKYMILYYII